MGLRRDAGDDQGLCEYHLGASFGEKISDEGCNFQTEVSNMQTTDRFGAGAKIPVTLYLLKDGPVQRADE